jgi:hypothetical protein
LRLMHAITSHIDRANRFIRIVIGWRSLPANNRTSKIAASRNEITFLKLSRIAMNRTGRTNNDHITSRPTFRKKCLKSQNFTCA